MLLAFVESHIVDILLNALLLAARTNHQNIVSVHHNIIAQTIDYRNLILRN